MGLGSFELGRLSKGDDSSGIKISYPVQMENQSASVVSAINLTSKENTSAKNFFASSRGSKYYPIGCSAGKTIVPENRVYFKTGEEAQKAGYELSSSCR